MSVNSKRWVRLIVLCFFTFLLWGLLCPMSAWAADYSDLQGHWARERIERWSDSGVLAGYDDGTFGPDKPVTRAELSAILYQLRAMTPVDDHFDYPDVAPGDWYYDSLTTMNMYGMALNTGGRMYPNQALTREEAVYMIAKALFIGQDQPGVSGLSGFTDSGQVAERYVGRIKNMLAAKHISGYPDGTFGPRRNITRAEVMTIIDSIVDVYISKPGEYAIGNRQTALITCGGVTLTFCEQPKSYQTPQVYLMGDDAGGVVTFTSSVEGNTPFFHLYKESPNAPQWRTEGNCRVTVERPVADSALRALDTRFAGGQGVQYFPYIIRTPEQFHLLAEQNDSQKQRLYYQLAGDLDLGSLTEPIAGAGEDRMIYAHLDGAGHTLTYRMKNHGIDQPYAGLFYAWTGSCSNLTLAGTADIAFVREAAEGLDDPSLFYGGFACYFGGRLDNCTARMDITVRAENAGNLSAGGLAGAVMDCRLNGCMASGQVQAILNDHTYTANVGGLLGVGFGMSGFYWGGQFSQCGADGGVCAKGGDYSNAGGIVGTLSKPTEVEQNHNSLENCWSTASVSAFDASFQSNCGGLIGLLHSGSVRSSWAKPSIAISAGGYEDVGGIAGLNGEDGSIENCWANSSGCPTKGSVRSGGIVGRQSGPVSNCYVLGAEYLSGDSAVANASWAPGLITSCIDLTGTTQAQRDSFYQSCGWDFTGVWDKSGTYPTLRGCDQAAQRLAQ